MGGVPGPDRSGQGGVVFGAFGGAAEGLCRDGWGHVEDHDAGGGEAGAAIGFDIAGSSVGGVIAKDLAERFSPSPTAVVGAADTAASMK